MKSITETKLYRKLELYLMSKKWFVKPRVDEYGDIKYEGSLTTFTRAIRRGERKLREMRDIIKRSLGIPIHFELEDGKFLITHNRKGHDVLDVTFKWHTYDAKDPGDKKTRLVGELRPMKDKGRYAFVVDKELARYEHAHLRAFLMEHVRHVCGKDVEKVQSITIVNKC